MKNRCSKCDGDLAERAGKYRYCKKCHAEFMRNTRPKHKDLPADAKKRQNARNYARVYLKRGKIQKKPCVKCGSEKSQMHHEDYNKPLEIVWFCRMCHLQEHKEKSK